MNLDEKRAYNSELRQQQKQQTRNRILEGLVKVMADGLVDVSIPAVAEASGVSIPTIYRHFPTKQALVAALPAYLAQKIGAPSLDPQPDFPTYLEALNQFYAKADQMDDTLRAAAMSEAAVNLRRTTRPERLQMIEEMLRPFTTDLPAAEQERLRNVVLVLASSAVMKAFTDYLGTSWEAAAIHATWAIETLVHSVSQPPAGEVE
ncbi:TetR/AcrR family transcriptional regulator [Candidatus Leptofilum sp.]|uniref:TetR/AcrR family transcriptional regulator n=1 Tax=Candidatus Leptofilum sp. TaxID=3241576 RepID=UPI003B59C02B